MLLQPVVFDDKANPPAAKFFAPVVVLYIDLYPIAAL